MTKKKSPLESLRGSVRTAMEPLLQNPVKLRLVVLGVLGLMAFGLVFWPLKSGIREREAELHELEARSKLYEQLAGLETFGAIYRARVPENADVNFWSNHLMEGMRQTGLKLLSFEPSEPEGVEFGGYQALVINTDVQGRYPELVRFLAWLEYNEIFCRVVQITIQEESGNLMTTLTVVALIG